MNCALWLFDNCVSLDDLPDVSDPTSIVTKYKRLVSWGYYDELLKEFASVFRKGNSQWDSSECFSILCQKVDESLIIHDPVNNPMERFRFIRSLLYTCGTCSKNITHHTHTLLVNGHHLLLRDKRNNGRIDIGQPLLPNLELIPERPEASSCPCEVKRHLLFGEEAPVIPEVCLHKLIFQGD